MSDSVIRAKEQYHPQTLLEECKYEIKKDNMENLINDDLDPSSSDKSDNESLTRDLKMNLTMMNLMTNLLTVKTIF